MPTSFQLTGVALAIGSILAFAAKFSKAEPVEARAAYVVESQTVQKSHREHANNHSDQISLAHRYTEDIKKLERAHTRRSKAAARMKDSRRHLQATYQNDWRKIINKNRAKFGELRKAAAKDPTGEIPCTICEEKQYLADCILCPDESGKCDTCDGKGLLFADETCPSCLGSGECFMCFGIGQMPCPFCNDGMVDARRHGPPDQIPIE